MLLSPLKNTNEERKLSLAMAPGSFSPSEIAERGFQFPAIHRVLRGAPARGWKLTA
jgi:hypothetical protein